MSAGSFRLRKSVASPAITLYLQCVLREIMEFHSSHIPPLLRVVLSGNASLSEINSLVRHAHHFALVRLKQLIASGRLHLQSFPITLESTAIDCIAELFERDSDGVFIELEHFFSAEHDCNVLTDDDIVAHFRSLVFTKLKDGIFQLYRENDPVFSKILRNLKIAIEKTPGISTIERFGITYLLFSTENNRNMHLPEYPLDEFVIEAARRFRQGDSSGNFLMVLRNILTEQDQYRQIYSLFDCTLLLKRISALHKIPMEEIFDSEHDLMEQDIQSIVERTLIQIRNDLCIRYVHSGKFTRAAFDRYFSAIEEMIIDTFVRSDGSEKTYDQYLQRYIEDLTYNDYRTNHRVQFEYMTKLAKKAVREQLKELL